jgi:hypothetical protein
VFIANRRSGSRAVLLRGSLIASTSVKSIPLAVAPPATDRVPFAERVYLFGSPTAASPATLRRPRDSSRPTNRGRPSWQSEASCYRRLTNHPTAALLRSPRTGSRRASGGPSVALAHSGQIWIANFRLDACNLMPPRLTPRRIPASFVDARFRLLRKMRVDPVDARPQVTSARGPHRSRGRLDRAFNGAECRGRDRNRPLTPQLEEHKSVASTPIRSSQSLRPKMRMRTNEKKKTLTIIRIRLPTPTTSESRSTSTVEGTATTRP